jgi:hypothetical protein
VLNQASASALDQAPASIAKYDAHQDEFVEKAASGTSPDPSLNEALDQASALIVDPDNLPVTE